ncbi:hypothetical protein AAC387_Pa07g3525 [Persea americana]
MSLGGRLLGKEDGKAMSFRRISFGKKRESRLSRKLFVVVPFPNDVVLRDAVRCGGAQEGGREDVMFGGTGTVALTIEWAKPELMKGPGELRKVQEELAQVAGLDRKVHENDLDNLAYV